MKLTIEVKGIKGSFCGTCKFLEIACWSDEEFECMLFAKARSETGLELQSKNGEAVRCPACMGSEVKK